MPSFRYYLECLLCARLTAGFFTPSIRRFSNQRKTSFEGCALRGLSFFRLTGIIIDTARCQISPMGLTPSCTQRHP
nr:MAG TPA: hypothetical protein [Caudoviricetes sp.]